MVKRIILKASSVDSYLENVDRLLFNIQETLPNFVTILMKKNGSLHFCYSMLPDTYNLDFKSNFMMEYEFENNYHPDQNEISQNKVLFVTRIFDSLGKNYIYTKIQGKKKIYKNDKMEFLLIRNDTYEKMLSAQEKSTQETI
jgi:hypothetical protein